MGHAQSRSYNVGLSQILTKNLIAGVNVNVITDNGYLANPYRSYRYLDPSNAKGYSLASQIYPDTRTSTAVQGEAKYYLPYRAAITGSYRYFTRYLGYRSATPTSSTTRIPSANIWILEGRLRFYKQNNANFYSDLYQFAGEYNFMARDQDLAARRKYHDRREGHLCVPARRLEDVQTRHRHIRS